MSEEDMLKLFKAEVERAGGCRGFARQAGVHHSVVAEAMQTDVVGPKLLTALGLVRVPTYHRITP